MGAYLYNKKYNQFHFELEFHRAFWLSINASAFPVANRSLFHSVVTAVGARTPRPAPPPPPLREGELMLLSLLLLDTEVPNFGDEGNLFVSFLLNGPRGGCLVVTFPPLLLPSRVSLEAPVFPFEVGVAKFCLVGVTLGPPATQDMPLSFVVTSGGEEGTSRVLAPS